MKSIQWIWIREAPKHTKLHFKKKIDENHEFIQKNNNADLLHVYQSSWSKRPCNLKFLTCFINRNGQVCIYHILRSGNFSHTNHHLNRSSGENFELNPCSKNLWWNSWKKFIHLEKNCHRENFCYYVIINTNRYYFN